MSHQESLPNAPPPAKVDPHEGLDVDFLNIHCRKVLGIPGWRWNEWSAALPAGRMVSGAVCSVLYARGERKGEPNWSKRDRTTQRSLYVGDAELMAAKRAWEAETGRCCQCFGSRLEWAGWSKGAGHRYRDCDRCGATGKAVQP